MKNNIILSTKRQFFLITILLALIIGYTANGAAYQSQFISMNIGSTNWCAGEIRVVTVTVKNIGTATWTNSGVDVNIGVKWNAEADYYVRTDANNLAPGATQTYSFTVTAPAAGTNNLKFDVVKEGDCWFAGNAGSCGPGNVALTSAALTIYAQPGPAGTITGTAAVCQGRTGVAYSVPAITNATGYNWSLPSGATITAGSNTRSITVSYSNSATSGMITVVGTNGTCNGTVSPNYAVTVNPLPDINTVTGGGTYCFGASGVEVGLNDSQSGVNYQLKLNGTNTGSPLAGTGSVLSYGNQTTVGAYTVLATDATTTCSLLMTGTATVIANTNLTTTVLSTQNISCYAGSDGTIKVQANGGTATYQFSIDNGGSWVSGSNPYTFTGLTAGSSYKIRVKDSIGCTSALIP